MTNQSATITANNYTAKLLASFNSMACPEQGCLDDEVEDLYQVDRHQALADGINQRSGQHGCQVSPGLVLEQAAERYFELVRAAEKSLVGMFSVDEFNIMLNTRGSEIWVNDEHMVVAVANSLDIASLDELDEESDLRVLLQKLSAINELQESVLVDVCERIWRGYENPLLD